VGVQYEKVWQFDSNRQYTPPDAITLSKYQLWYMKAFLLGQIGNATQGLFTVVGSSDGVTAALDGVDRLGAVFDPAKLVFAPTSTAKSWILLLGPTENNKPLYIFMDLNSTSGTDRVTWVIANQAPTGGGTSAAAVPTWPANTYFAMAQPALNDGVAAPRRMNAGLTTDGKQVYFLFAKEGTNCFQSFIMFGCTADYRTTDTSPFYLYGAYGAGNIHPGDVTATNANVANGGSPAHFNCAILYRTFRGVTNPFGGNTIADAITGKYQDMGVEWMAYSPIVAFKGRIPDFGITNAVKGTGVWVDDLASPKSVVSYHLWIPYPTLPVI
jgi:hypothetical protein